MKRIVETESNLFSLRNVLVAAGVIVLAPYVIRRLLPLFTENPENTSARDVAIAGKDSVRDAADDFNIGGISGTLNRGIDRIADRLS